VFGCWLSNAAGWTLGRDKEVLYERCVEADDAREVQPDSGISDLEDPVPDSKDDSEKPEPLAKGFRSHEMLDTVQRDGRPANGYVGRKLLSSAAFPSALAADGALCLSSPCRRTRGTPCGRTTCCRRTWPGHQGQEA
jgi:hypothetical protein